MARLAAVLGVLMAVSPLGLTGQTPALLPPPQLLWEVGEPVLIGFAFSPSSNEIIVATSRGLEVWDLESQTRREYKEVEGLHGFAVSNAAGIMALAFRNHLEIWDATSLTKIKEFDYPTGAVSFVRRHGYLITKPVFSPSGRYLATKGFTSIALYDLTTNSVKLVEIPVGDITTVDALAFLTDDRLIVSAYPRLFLWELGTGRVSELAKLGARYNTVGVNPSRGLLAYPGEGEMLVVDVSTGEELGAYPCVADTNDWWGFSPDGAAIFVPNAFGRLSAYEIGQAEPVCDLAPEAPSSADVVEAVFSPSGDRIGVLEVDKLGFYTIRVWDWRGCSELARLERHWDRSAGKHVAFSQHGRYLVRNPGDRLEVWDTQNHKLLVLRHVLGSLFAVSPTESLVAAEEKFGTQLLFWNWETGEESTLNPQWFGLTRISGLCFAPDGRRLVIADDAGNLAVWDLKRKDMVLSIPNAHQGPISGIFCSPDGALLVSTGGYGNDEYPLKVWSLGSGELLAQRKLRASSWFFLNSRTLIFSGSEFGERGWRTGVVKTIVFDDRGQIVEEKTIPISGQVSQVALETVSGNPLLSEVVSGPTGRELVTLLYLWDWEKVEPAYQWRLDWSVSKLVPVPGRRAVAAVREDGIVEVVSVNMPPQVDFTFRPERVTPGIPVEFVATATDPEGGPVELEWDFGDGTVANEEVVAHSFRTPGEYLVRLVAVDDAGEETVVEHVVVVQENRPPVAKFTWAPSDPRPLEEISLRDESTDPDGEIVSRQWEIAGGRFEGPEVSCRFCQPGTYPITLTVRDDRGAEASFSAQIEVSPGSHIVGVSLPPHPGGPGDNLFPAPFESPGAALGRYEVRLSPADLSLATPGAAVQITRCVATPAGTFIVEVGEGRISSCSGDTAWITVDRVVEGMEVHIGDQVLFPRR